MNSQPASPTNIRVIAIMTVATLVLLAPLVAMQFSGEVNWGGFDFLIMGILLYGTGLACELVLRRFRSTGQRMLICGIILLVLLLTWVELAVGIFGTPFAGS